MALTYQQYLNRATSWLAPQRNAELRDTTAGLVDKGLGASTAGQGALSNVRQQYAARAGQEAEAMRQWQGSFDEQQRQYNRSLGENARQYNKSYAANREDAARQTAQTWFDMVNSMALAKKSAFPKAKVAWANQPTWLRSYLTNSSLGYDAPTGDGKGKIKDPTGPLREADYESMGVSMPSHFENMGKSLNEINSDRDYELQKQQLAMARAAASAAKAEDEVDPWDLITDMALRNSTEDQRPDDPNDPLSIGFQAGALPTKLLQAWTASPMYGNLDVMALAHKGDPRAIAVVKMLYPKTWQFRIGPDMSYGEYANAKKLSAQEAAAQGVIAQRTDNYTPASGAESPYGYSRVPAWAPTQPGRFPLVDPNPFR